MLDHLIFSESIRRIRLLLAEQAAADPARGAALAGLSPLERDVLERCIHSSGDVTIAAELRFSTDACAIGAAALAAGAPI
ncbi:MAG: precorrin-8X methylmutase, partial [Cyanobium sp.]